MCNDINDDLHHEPLGGHAQLALNMCNDINYKRSLQGVCYCGCRARGGVSPGPGSGPVVHVHGHRKVGEGGERRYTEEDMDSPSDLVEVNF